MSKTFTCRELMGICDEQFSGDTFMEIVEKGMRHMQSNDAHKAHMANLLKDHKAGDKKRWFAEMQKVFDAKPDDG